MRAFIGFYMVTVFYKYVEAQGANGMLNTACFYLGILIMFGIMMVGNFQFVSIRVCHFIGAFLAFFGGIAFEWCASVLSLRYLRTPTWITGLRFAISSGTTLSVIMMLVSAKCCGEEKEADPEVERFWANMTDGWEWALGLMHLVFFSSFAFEFSKISATEFRILIDQNSVNCETTEMAGGSKSGAGRKKSIDSQESDL